MQTYDSSRRPRAVPTVVALALSLLTLAAQAGHAQTDYYNLDRGRPLRTEDALPIERHALEWQIAPFRISGASGAGSVLSLEPELAWGALPRTQVELGFPLERWQRGGRVVTGGAGVDVSVLHALNAETMTLPALALAARVLVPMGAFAADRAYPTFTAIATRTTSLGRLHANASYTAGAMPESPAAGAEETHGELSRWEAGIAVDRPFPIRAFLVGAELVARSPLERGASVEWSAASGVRYQLSPRLALDLGAGRELSRDGEWFVTFGSALSFALLHRFGGVR